MSLLEKVQNESALAWVNENNFVTESGAPIEFKDHFFMIDPFSDMSEDLVCMKSAQVGYTVMYGFKTFHMAKSGLYVGYVLPTHNVVSDFVNPKVDPLIEKNPKIKELMGKVDSKTQKKIGDRFIFYRGAFSMREAISVTLDALIIDELDQCPDTKILNAYDSRLQASKYGLRHRFSNPTIPAFGIHDLYQESDQKHWFVTCSRCNHRAYMMWERDDHDSIRPHYVNQEAMVYSCGKCYRELRENDRRFGEWVAKFRSVERSGYWISQLMAPWVPAKRIIKQHKESTTEFFYNFVLGLPFQQSELLINREAIIRCIRPGVASKESVVMGVDVGMDKHWVLGNHKGIFAYGKTQSWEEIELMIKMYNATTVIDALPDFTIPQQLAKKYIGKVFVHYYEHDTKRIEVSVRDEDKNYGVIKSDRTKLLDILAADINNQTVEFYVKQDKLEPLMNHSENMYRMVETDTRGIKRARWMTKDNKPDHWLHALVYWKVGLNFAMKPDDSGGVSPIRPIKSSGVVVKDGGIPAIDIQEVIKQQSSGRHKI